MKSSFLGLFHKHRCIFVHIPKTAGISMLHAFFGHTGLGHGSIIEAKDHFSQEQFNTYFKFAFVRNPWARALSSFSYLKNGGRNAMDKAWVANNIAHINDFNVFVTEWLTEERSQKAIHFRPQSDFITDNNGEILMDFIGHFEHLYLGIDHVVHNLDEFGSSVNFSHHNPSPQVGVDYRSFYSQKAKEVIGRIYDKDIKTFGYAFDKSTPSFSHYRAFRNS